MEIKFISYIPAILGVVSIGLFVFLNNPRNIKNRIFAATNLLIAAWLSSLFIADTTTDNNIALWALRSGLFFGQFMSLFLYLFALSFPFTTKVSRKTALFLIVPIPILAILLLTPLGVVTVDIKDYGVEPNKIGPLYALTDLITIGYLVLAFITLIKKRKQASSSQAKQIKFVLYGLTVAALGNIFSGIIAVALGGASGNFIWLGSFSLFIFSIIVTYSIIKHRLFDVRLIVARSITYIGSIAVLGTFYGWVSFSLVNGAFGTARATVVQEIAQVGVVVLAAFCFPYVRDWFNKTTNKIFYRDAYDPQVFLDELNKELVSTVNTEQLLKDCSVIITKNIKAEYCLFGLNETEYFGQRILGNAEKVFSKSDISDVRATMSNLHEVVLVTEELDDEHSDLRRKLRKYDVAILARLTTDVTSDQEGLGYMLLGQKKSGNPYNKQDIQLLEIIANELVIATQNALRFEEIENFNATLQQKVDDATRKLQRANEKLKALDETKDEFISMASHQLRTPLTSVKGYVSMVLEGDAGELQPMQKKLLEQSFASSQRMVYLIADLLNLSRLRTGKFVIDAKPTNLADVIESEVEQLKASAAGRGLSLSFNKPKTFTSLMLDEVKIRQVIMNFSDNAIYYTPAGGKIEISLKETKDSVEFNVNDNGIGVPAHEQRHLFTKFYRAKNAQKARPDGTGLGLFMAKKVIIAQGGALVFKSVHDKGSTFGFTFSKTKLKVPAHLASTDSKT